MTDGPVQLECAIQVLRDGEVAIDAKRAALLRAIGRTGSISAAARDLAISYRHAWLMVDGINRAFDDKAVEAVGGGRNGGGAELTPLGRDILASYAALEDHLDDLASGPLRRIGDMIGVSCRTADDHRP